MSSEKQHPVVAHFFDVGHGETILIEFPDQSTLGILDCQIHRESNRLARDNGLSDKEPKVLSFLRILRRKRPLHPYRVAFLCLSHFHDDHFFGMPSLITGLRELKIPIIEFWDAGVSPKKVAALSKNVSKDARKQVKIMESLYSELTREISNGLKHDSLTNGRDIFRTYGDVKLELLAPYSLHWQQYLRFLDSSDQLAHVKKNPLSADENLISSVILLKYGQGTMLLTGDIPNIGWQQLLQSKSQELSKLQVVKASHHGSREGNFLQEDQTSVWDMITQKGRTKAIISGGYRSALPHKDTLNAINKSGALLYCTGDYREIATEDPIDKANLPMSVVSHIKAESSAVVDGHKSLHGDVKVSIFPSGHTEVATEFNPSAFES